MGKLTGSSATVSAQILNTQLSDGSFLVKDNTHIGLPSRVSGSPTSPRARNSAVPRSMTGKTAYEHNFIVNRRFNPHAITGGNLINGRQQHSGVASQLVHEPLAERARA